jgi:hypothetical protein
MCDKILNRPRDTFLNKHAKFNRRNLLAVNRLNQHQITQNNKQSSKLKQILDIPKIKALKLSVDVRSSDNFVFIEGKPSPKSFLDYKPTF